MSLPEGITTVRFYDDFKTVDWEPASTKVTLRPSKPLVSTLGVSVIPRGVVFAGGDGVIDVTVPATDAPEIVTEDWYYIISIEAGHYRPAPFPVFAPAGADLRISDLVPATPVDEMTPTVRTVNGIGPDPAGNIELEFPQAGPLFTVADWEATRPAPYFIAHRGSGDVIPECSLEAYEYAVNCGAKAMEVSVNVTSDGVLVVNHDNTWDRTVSNLDGRIDQTPSTMALNWAKIQNMTQTGYYWRDFPPKVVTFEEILRKFGGRVVMCVEAKDDKAYPAMMAMVERYGLGDSTIVKAFHTSPRIDEARAAGYKTFVYLGNADISQANIDAAAAHADYLVVPGYAASGDGYEVQDQSVIDMALATGRPVWCWPLHRRSDAQRLVAMGVEGIITSSYGYVSSESRLVSADRWWTKMISPGEVAINQADPIYAVEWGDNELTLGRTGYQFISLGAFCPTPASGYTLEFDVRWLTDPADSTALIWLAWGRSDDRYYQYGHNSGIPGNQAYVRTSGVVGLNRHSATGSSNGNPSEAGGTTPLVAGTWVPLRLEVTATGATITRTDTGESAVWVDATNRGGYLYFGKRTTGAGKLSIRNFRLL